jgi:hypothetical protein
MDKQKWKEICDETLEKMKEHVEPFITPIWKYKEENDILLHGSASYIEYANEKFIISNEHVAKANLHYHLTLSFKGNENIFNIKNHFLGEEYPIDVSITKVDNNLWIEEHMEGKAIPLERFSSKHATVDGELLFFAGFSGERSKVLFENCISRGTPFLTQECQFPTSLEEANPTFHISIPYSPELAETKNIFDSLPNPHGFSGSLLWNTKRKECILKKLQWDPSMAEVTAVIWGWPSSSVCILATKIEHINLKKMISYYNQSLL